MSEQNTNAWPFPEVTDANDLDINAIFGGGGTDTADTNPFATPAPVTPQTPPAATVPSDGQQINLPCFQLKPVL